MTDEQKYLNAGQRIYIEWDRALAANDVEGLLALYTPDATLESPLIPHLLDKAEGICRGQAELRELFEILAVRKPNLRKYYRTPCLQLERLIMWEYPRHTPAGEQMDFCEVMHLSEDGLIESQRVYWGWRGVKVMQQDAYHR